MLKRRPLRRTESPGSRLQPIVKQAKKSEGLVWMYKKAVVVAWALENVIRGKGGVSAEPKGAKTWIWRPSGRTRPSPRSTVMYGWAMPVDPSLR